MSRLNESNNFFWLTAAMVGLLVTGAFSRDVPDNITIEIIEFTGIGLLMVSLLSLKSRHVWVRRLIILIALMAVMAIIRSATGHHHLDYFYLLLMLAFLVAAAWLVAGHVLLTGSIDLNKLVGAVALYLILGMIWSVLYTIVLGIFPDAFRGIEPGPWYDNLPVTTYFSFVTLTTLGYGDIVPVRPMAEILVVLEAVTGMFYLAVIVASLVGALRTPNTD